MSLEFCVLASGSEGNCSIVRTPAGVMLIDAGLGPRSVAKRLCGTGIALRDIKAICLTHLDADHFRPTWLGAMLNFGIRVFCHRTRVRDVLAILDSDAADPLVVGFRDTFEPLPGLATHAVPVAHDQTGAHAFRFDGFNCRIGYATDLGRVPESLLSAFASLDLLAIESNYDTDLQMQSTRPWFLKKRIMGGHGHLSNQQAFDAIRELLNRAERTQSRLPRHIVLLHRSRECNCPNLMRDLFTRDKRIASRLTLANQFDRTDWLRLHAAAPLIGEQLALAWG